MQNKALKILKKRPQIVAEINAKLPSVLTAEQKGTSATITMRGYIGGEQLNVNKVAAIVDDLLAKKVTEVIVKLSSPGGNVFEANDIVAELERLPKVYIQVGAICASAATRFLTAFDAESRPNSQFMIHKPMLSSGGNETEIEADLKKLKDATNDYRTAYATKMKITEDEVEKLWGAGDKWLTATEAKKYGLISKISGSEAPIDADTKLMLEACGAPKSTHNPTPKYMEREELIALLGLEATATDDQIKAAIAAAKKPVNPKKDMDKVQLIASLGLDADASDEQIAAAVKKNKQAADAYAASLKGAEDKLNAEAEADVDAAIASKKIVATLRDTYIKMYKVAPVETKAALAAIPEGKAVSAQLDTKSGDEDASRKDWTLEDYMDKDPKALAAMEKSNPEKFKQLNTNYFGS